ncbi:hypothetical protein TNCV_2216251 [Trichonephila clavipes]|nr:hypothetical protein TNCV_2216251 [Trichonephila clavipes]
MLKHLRFDIFELLEKKLPVRLINTTNEWRLVKGHGDTQRNSNKGERGYRRCGELDSEGQGLHFLNETPRILESLGQLST